MKIDKVSCVCHNALFFPRTYPLSIRLLHNPQSVVNEAIGFINEQIVTWMIRAQRLLPLRNEVLDV